MLDIKTLAFVSGIISLVLSICMLYVRQTRKTYPGFNEWTVASIFNFLGMFFLSLRGVLPDFFSVIIANSLLLLAQIYIASGLLSFADCRSKNRLFFSLVGLNFLLLAYFTYTVPDVNSRMSVMSIFMAIVNIINIHTLKNDIPRLIEGKNRFLLTIFSFVAVFLFFRAFTATFLENQIADFMISSAFRITSFMIFICGHVFIFFGLLVQNFRRVEADYQKSLTEIKTLRGIIPICSSCKKIRNDAGIWDRIETYFKEHSKAEFSHGICPDCARNIYPDIDLENDDD